eukprot:6986213-Alexandrium_andersonii.AAC.1
MAAHMVRLFADVARQDKKPSAIVFVDVRNAFYSVQRAFVFTRPASSAAAFLDKMASAGAPHALLEDLLVTLAAPAADRQAAIPPE